MDEASFVLLFMPPCFNTVYFFCLSQNPDQSLAHQMADSKTQGKLEELVSGEGMDSRMCCTQDAGIVCILLLLLLLLNRLTSVKSLLFPVIKLPAQPSHPWVSSALLRECACVQEGVYTQHPRSKSFLLRAY